MYLSACMQTCLLAQGAETDHGARHVRAPGRGQDQPGQVHQVQAGAVLMFSFTTKDLTIIIDVFMLIMLYTLITHTCIIIIGVCPERNKKGEEIKEEARKDKNRQFFDVFSGMASGL